MAELKLKILVEAMERISAPFKRATESTTKLKDQLKVATDNVRALEKAAASIEAFGRLKNAARENADALAKAQEKAQKLGRELAEAGGGGRKLQTAFNAARREVDRLKESKISISRELQTMRGRMAESGIDTRNLADSQRRLKQDLDEARKAAQAQATALENLKTKTEAVAAARVKMDKTKALAGRLAMAGGIAAAAGGTAMAVEHNVVGASGDFQHDLAAYGLTAGQTGEQLQQVRQRLMEMSAQVNQSAKDLLAGQAILVGKGMNPDDALKSISIIGRAVTATGAEMADMSSLAFSVMDNLKVPQAELARAFDIMAKAGDEGGFELKNMATYFPQLTAAAYQLGMTGTSAISSMSAALQIAQKGAADPSEAANNMANFLKALTGKEAVKNFNEKGIDIKQALMDGVMAGKDPIETMMKAVGSGLGVDLEAEMRDAMAAGLDPQEAMKRIDARFNLSELFGDAQAQNFLAPMLANMAEYRRIRDATMKSDGGVDAKFTTMMQTYNEVSKGLDVDMANVRETMGNIMLPSATATLTQLRSLVQGINSFAQANPRLTATLVKVAAVLAVMITVGGGVAMAVAAMLGPFALARFALTTLGVNAGFVTGAMTLMRGGMVMMSGVASTVFTMLISGIRAVSIAFMSNPIGLIITAIAAAAALIYIYWEPIKAFFADLWEGVGTSFKGTLDFILMGLQIVFSPLQALANVLGHVIGDDFKKKINDGLKSVSETPVKVAKTTAAAAVVSAPMAAGAAPAPDDAAKAGGTPKPVAAQARGAGPQAPAPRPAVPAAVQPGGGGSITIVVNAAPGQSEDAIAKAVRAELEKWQQRQKTDARSRLYDGER